MQLFMGHIVSSLHLLKEKIFFSCVSPTQFLSLVCVSLFSPPPKFSPKLFFLKLFLVFLFLQGEKLVFNLCSSQGELSLFPIKLICFVFPSFSIFSYSVAYAFYLLIGQSLSICDKKGGEIVDMWESYLFCLGGFEIVFENGRI